MTRWVARILSLILALFLIGILLMVLSGGKQTSASDAVSGIFLVCLIAGLILSWPKELLGIILFYTGFAGLFIMLVAHSEKGLFNLTYVLIPTTLLLVCRVLEKNSISDTAR